MTNFCRVISDHGIDLDLVHEGPGNPFIRSNLYDLTLYYLYFEY